MQRAIQIVSMLCLAASQSEAAIEISGDFSRMVTQQYLNVNGLSDWTIKTLLLTVFYVGTYFSVAYSFESTRAPEEITPQRIANRKKEIELGVVALGVIIVFVTLWIWKIEPSTPFYGYFDKHAYTVSWFLTNTAFYFMFMDTFFYWSHRFLHITKPYNIWWHIHRHHHQFTDPTPYAQDAVHWFEALLQGPLPHYLCCACLPMPQAVAGFFGFLTAVYAIAAHDSRQYDLNDHQKHHHYKNCNFGLYWGWWDFICDTRYNPGRNPTRAVSPEDELKRAKAQ